MPDRDEHPVDASKALMRRARLLAWQLEREIQHTLEQLGHQSANAFFAQVRRGVPDSPRDRERLVAHILRTIGIKGWLDRHLRPVLHNHGARVVKDTERTLQTEISTQLHDGLETTHTTINLHIGPEQTGRIMAGAGKDLKLPDIEPQARQAILRAVEDGYARGENPMAIARRIRQYVPAGRFTNAGTAYRSKLIARTETLNLQRESTLAAYDSNESITSIQIRDGMLPDSDDFCQARDGMIVPKEDAASVQPAHPQCTLSYSPVVSLERVREPELAGVA